MRFSHLVGVAALVPALGAALPPGGGRVEAQVARGVEARGAHRLSIAQLPGDPLDMAPYKLTNICVHCWRPRLGPPSACTIAFDWSDPNSVRQNNVSSAHCSYGLTWDGATPVGGGDSYVTCLRDGSNYFEVNLVDFQGPDNFTLDLGHHYRDDENFTAPWVYPTTFATPQLSLPLLQQVNGSNSSSVTYYDPGPVYTNITQVAD